MTAIGRTRDPDIATNPLVRALIDLSLLEDIGSGDVTSQVTLPPDARAHGVLVAREPGVLAGLPIAEAVFRTVDATTVLTPRQMDGSRFDAGAVLAEVEGNACSVLTAERTALNFLWHLCGIATLTARYVEEVRGLSARIVDTRKTIPGWRAVSKYAVRMGGGLNHRFGLSDGVLIKDNHVAVVGSVGASVEAARRSAPHSLRVEVEVETLDQLDEAIAAGAEVILLDNMTIEEMRAAVRRTKGRALLEASGGIRLNQLRAIAETGVDIISTSAITSDARPIDISLDVTVSTP